MTTSTRPGWEFAHPEYHGDCETCHFFEPWEKGGTDTKSCREMADYVTALEADLAQAREKGKLADEAVPLMRSRLAKGHITEDWVHLDDWLARYDALRGDDL